MVHPFPYIKELENLPKIETLSDILFVRDFVFSLIPWGPEPYTGNAIEKGVEELYYGFRRKKIFGWCGLNAEFFRLIICGYRVRCWSYNYGLDQYQISHAGAVVDLCEREGFIDLIGLPFFIDPYFCKHYLYMDDFPLTFTQLIDFVQKRKTNFITPSYGKCKKPVWDIEKQQFIDRTPQEFENGVLDFFREKMNYNEVMKKTFGDLDPTLLMMLKIPN